MLPGVYPLEELALGAKSEVAGPEVDGLAAVIPLVVVLGAEIVSLLAVEYSGKLAAAVSASAESGFQVSVVS